MKKILTVSALLQTLLFASFDGTIIDKTTKLPIEKAIVSDSVKSVKTDENGSFCIDSKEKTTT